MGRRLFMFASGLSLLLCLTGIVLWTRSYACQSELSWRTWRIHGFFKERRSCRIDLGCGVLGFLSVTDVDPGALFFPDGSVHYAKPRPDDLQGLRLTFEKTNRPLFAIDDTPLERLGFLRIEHRAGHADGYSDIDFVFVPVWLLVAGLGVLPAAAGAMILRPRLPAASHCSRCDYDLRASKDRCPECGTAVGV